MEVFDVVILGGGLSGQMMAKRLDGLGLSSCIIDKGGAMDHSFHLHRPIHELKYDWRPHKFHLGIWDGASLRGDTTPADANHYSQKLCGKLSGTNILNFTSQQQSEIYPISKADLSSILGSRAILVKDTAVAILPGAKVIELDSGAKIGYTYLISTVALPLLLKLCDWELTLELECFPFWCMAIPLGYSSTMYQMVYNTDPNMVISRATLIDDTLYLDMIGSDLGARDEQWIFHAFRVANTRVARKIWPGRFTPLPREKRKQFIHSLTALYDIFLLGRYGAWTFKVANDVWDDTAYLCELITNKEHVKKGELLWK